MKISEHLEEALLENKLNLRKKSYQSYESKLRNFRQWLEEKEIDTLPISEFDYTLAQKFLNEFDRHIKTRYAHRQFLNHYFEIFRKRKIIPCNPFEETTLPKKRTSKALRHFNKKEVGILKEALKEYHPELWFFVQCMFYTLIRPNELRLLKVEDIHLTDNLILVRGENAKNHHSQFITIPEVFQVNLEAYIEKLPKHHYLFGGHIPRGQNYFNNYHHRILESLNLKTQDVALYSWKHTGAIFFINQTRDLHSLMRQMRHSSLDITQCYLASRNITFNSVIRNEYPML
jgi:site-specific recombinase XerD